MELSVSMHAGSKKNAIKNLDKIKKIDEHNNRKYKNVNNKEIDPTLSIENITLRGSKNITNDVKELYKTEFTEAVCKYNLKQKDERRKIVDYLEKMNKDEKNNIAVEFIYQVGDAETWKGRSLEDKKKTKEIFEKAIDILEAKGIKVANATIHLDETSPHMHIVGVPIVENQERGLEKQVSQRKVLTREVLKELREETEKVFIEEYKRVYKTNDVTLKKGSEIEEHLSVEDYKSTKKMLEVAKKYGNRKELKEEIEKKVDEVEKAIEGLENDKIEKSKKITNLENENKNLTNELTNLKEKNYSLNSEVKELETSKNTKEKEKDDIEKELDLYQKKIKDYKEQIEKDKEEAIKLEEDKKEQEKKNKAVKDEIDKKNKEYNDLLTEKNTLEEKKKKLDEEKQKIEDFYKNMETIITAEKEKMLKDVEDASIKLTEEKKKLEDANLELINANTELVNNNNALLKALETEKEKNTNITKEKEKIENENKEIEDSIKALKIEKTNLEADKIEISAGVKTLLENQKGYNDTLQLEYKKLENKKEVEKTADKNVTEIVFVVQGDFYPEAIYGKNYKSDYIFYNGDNIVDRIEGKEKDNLTYTVASAVYSVYGEEMKRTDLIYNTTTGKTDLIIDYLDYESEEKKTDTITFKEMKIDKFFTLVKEKLGELKETLIESIKQQFNYTNNHAKDMFTEEKNKKNIEKDDFEY
jgi:plasmid recombination enzyme